jgi:hypothetical protein
LSFPDCIWPSLFVLTVRTEVVDHGAVAELGGPGGFLFAASRRNPAFEPTGGIFRASYRCP